MDKLFDVFNPFINKLSDAFNPFHKKPGETFSSFADPFPSEREENERNKFYKS